MEYLRVFGTKLHIFFGRRAAKINRGINWRSDLLACFWTRVNHSLGSCCEAAPRFVCRGFKCLKTEEFSICFIFPPLVWRIVSPSESSFSGEFPCPFSFSGLVFLVALDSLYPSFRIFFVGVCRIAESESRAVDFGDLISANYVLRRSSEELFAFAFPVLNTWRLIKDRMASEGSSWPQVWSEELPSGLSDREDGGHSANETQLVSSSSKGDGSERL